MQSQCRTWPSLMVGISPMGVAWPSWLHLWGDGGLPWIEKVVQKEELVLWEGFPTLLIWLDCLHCWWSWARKRILLSSSRVFFTKKICWVQESVYCSLHRVLCGKEQRVNGLAVCSWWQQQQQEKEGRKGAFPCMEAGSIPRGSLAFLLVLFPP